MALSINTNYPAAVALLALTSNQDQLDVSKSRMATGLRVQTAADDAFVWGQAEGTKVKNSVLAGNYATASHVAGVLSVATGAAAQISVVLRNISALAASATSSDVTANRLIDIDNSYKALLGSIDSIVNGANAFSLNLIKNTTALSVNFLQVTGAAGVNSTTITGIKLDATTLGVAGTDCTSVANANTAIQKCEAAIQTVADAVAKLGAQQGLMEKTATSFKASLTLGEKAVSDFVDADLGVESSIVQALQVKQQLTAQSLTMANTNPWVLLRLFRN
jgi:flagellin